jgi:hypothetical protein
MSRFRIRFDLGRALADQEQIMTGVVKRDGSPAVQPKVRKSTDEVTGVIADDEIFSANSEGNSKFGGSISDTICDN